MYHMFYFMFECCLLFHCVVEYTFSCVRVFEFLCVIFGSVTWNCGVSGLMTGYVYCGYECLMVCVYMLTGLRRYGG